MTIGPRVALPAALAEEALHRAVLERVKRHHDCAAARPQQALDLVQAPLDLADLVVHADAKRLESARRRVDSAPGPARHRAAHDLGELAGARDRRVRTGRDDGPRDRPRPALLAEVGDDRGEIVLLLAIDQIGGGGTRIVPIHAHVERSVETEREAPRPVV